MLKKEKVIAQIGDPVLREKNKEIELNKINSLYVKNVTNKCIEIMRMFNGAGLAANQIFYNLRICVLEIKKNKRYSFLPEIPLQILINPKIKILCDKSTFDSYEGCLSVPNLRGKVKRYKEIQVDYFNEKAEFRTERVSGLKAVVYQHEIDHLNGILFTDKVTDKKSLVTYDNFIKFYEKEYIKSVSESFN